MSTSSANGPPPSASSSRNSSKSNHSPRHRNQVNLGTIEKSVTHLLVATKQLLETLTAWSRHQATENQVSDVYVRLGSEFNIACRAFTAIGVDTADLGNVPDALRTILESTLSQDASPQSLEVYLPRIREIIINLLHGLKRKQHKLRQTQANREHGSGDLRDHGSVSASLMRSGSIDATGEDVGAPPRTSSLPGGSQRDVHSPPVPSRDSSGSSHSRPPPARQQPPGTNGAVNGYANEQLTAHDSLVVTTPPYPTIEERTASPSVPAPPPIPQTQDALAALQQHSMLERRASKRYSTYQIAKMTGNRPDAFPMLPGPRDQSAIPRNRESMDAVRKRSQQHSRVRSSVTQSRGGTPVKNPNRISEESENSLHTPVPVTPAAEKEDSTPAETSRPPLSVDTNVAPRAPTPEEVTESNSVAPSVAANAGNDSSSESGNQLTLFLQIGRNIKKVILPDGESDISMPALRLLFMSKFSYNPPAGEDFPKIYLQDPVSGVRYELEDLRDIKDRAVLCLNIEVLDEVKRHIDDGMEGLRKLVQGIAGSVESQSVQINRITQQQEEAAKKIAALAAAPPRPVTPPSARSSTHSTTQATYSTADKDRHLAEIRDLRKDLAVLKQVYSSFEDDVKSSMANIRTKASSIKSIATAGPNEGRAYVEAGQKQVSSDADLLVTRVDDLQDTVEDLRKDVVSRGVRPLPRQLEAIAKDMAQARVEIGKMKEYLVREKPLWRRIWERELEVVCEEQEFLNMQESLVADLEDDLEKASQTFALVEQCSQQQMKPNAGGIGRNPSRGFAPHLDVQIPAAHAKDSVLSEVRALQPNHEDRLEAIERAERARKKELQGRQPDFQFEFQKELGKFVEEGKLKKTGGAEEVERMRERKEEENRKAMWETKLKLEQEEEESSEEEDSDEEDEEESEEEEEQTPK